MTPERAAADAATGGDTAFFGHPRGAAYLLAAEAGFSFAYYGIVTILTLYMTQQLFTPGHVEKILGFAAYRHALEAVSGPMTLLGLASTTFGVLTGWIYGTAILGGLIGDRWLGQRLTVSIGLVVLTLGYGLLVTEWGFLIAILLLIVGGGLVKSNLLSQLGRFYSTDDPRRTRAFGLFLIAVNVGGFLSPLVVGTLGEKVGWTPALIAAAVGMALATLIYLGGLRNLPADGVAEARAAKAEGRARPQLGRRGALVIGALLALLIPEMLNVGTYNQAFNIFPVWAKSHVNLNLFGFEMPVTWFSTLDGILTIVATAAAVRIWGWQSRDGREPRETSRIAVGCALTTVAFLMLTAGALLAAGGGKVAVVFPLAFFLFADSALPWIDTVIMSLYSRAAPTGLTTTMLGIYYLSFTAGNLLVGRLGRLYESMTPAAFWGLHAAIAAAALAFILLAGRPMSRVLVDEAPDLEDAAAASA